MNLAVVALSLLCGVSTSCQPAEAPPPSRSPSLKMTLATGSTRDQCFGWSVAILDAIPGVRVRNLAVGAPGSMTVLDGNGEVHILEGGNGARRQTWHGASPRCHFGYALCVVDDVNADGRRDLAVSSPGHETFALPGRVDIFSVATGELLMTVEGDRAGDEFGTSLACVADVDGDGRGELAVGIPPSLRFQGRVRLVSLTTGALLREFAPQGNYLLGHALHSYADVDCDGGEDLLSAFGPGAVVLSPRDGRKLIELSEKLGESHRVAMSARPFDYDRDGMQDLVLSFKDRPSVRSDHSVSNCGEQIRVYSGKDWSTLEARSDWGFYESFLVRTDASVDDWLLGTTQWEDGLEWSLQLRSLRTNELRYSMPISAQGTLFIHAVSDLDGDGGDDVILSAISHQELGAVEILRGLGR